MTEIMDGPACGSCGSGDSAAAAADDQDRKIEGSLSKIKHKLLVMSGKGGVGKSSVSANLAVGLAKQGYKVGLMDIDLHGPSLAGIMGIEGALNVNEEAQLAEPKEVANGMKIVSMQSLMEDSDQAIIWRGPVKTGIIRQFISDVVWGELDYLVIDAPPGTGDEPLTAAQTVPDAKAVIITTGQDVALADVRKSINFCKAVNMEMLGLIENMGPYTCKCCGKKVDLFKSGGGLVTSKKMGVSYLGGLPFEPALVEACDTGKPLMGEDSDSEFSKAMGGIIKRITERLD